MISLLRYQCGCCRAVADIPITPPIRLQTKLISCRILAKNFALPTDGSTTLINVSLRRGGPDFDFAEQNKTKNSTLGRTWVEDDRTAAWWTCERVLSPKIVLHRVDAVRSLHFPTQPTRVEV